MFDFSKIPGLFDFDFAKIAGLVGVNMFGAVANLAGWVKDAQSLFDLLLRVAQFGVAVVTIYYIVRKIKKL